MKIYTPVNLIITNDVAEVLLIKMKVDMEAFGDGWSIPGGVPRITESYEDALARAVEELLSCRLRHFTYFKSSYFQPKKGIHYRSVFYHGKITGEMMLSRKVLESQWFTLKDLQDPKLKMALNHKDIILNFVRVARKNAKADKSTIFNI